MLALLACASSEAPKMSSSAKPGLWNLRHEISLLQQLLTAS